MQRYNPLKRSDNALPPQDVKFLEIKVEPWPDGRRVRFHARMTPFQQPPNLNINITDENGQEVSSVNIIENIDFNLVITMHIRSQVVRGTYTLSAQITYPELGIVHEATTIFETQENIE